MAVDQELKKVSRVLPTSVLALGDIPDSGICWGWAIIEFTVTR